MLPLVLFHQPVEAVLLKPGERHCLLCRDHAAFPSPVTVLPVLRVLHPRPAQMLPACFGHLYSLPLQLMALCPVLIRHICEHCQHHIRDQLPHQLLRLRGIQNRHGSHLNVSANLFCNMEPLLVDLAVVPPEPLQLRHHQQVAFPQDVVNQRTVYRAFKLPPRFLLHIYVTLVNALLVPQDMYLPVWVLLPGTHTDISEFLCRHDSPPSVKIHVAKGIPLEIFTPAGIRPCFSVAKGSF